MTAVSNKMVARIKVNKIDYPAVEGQCFVREFLDGSSKPLFFSKKDTPEGKKNDPIERGTLTQVQFERFTSLKGVKLEQKTLDNDIRVVDYSI
jgi:hypothetical protein